MSTAFSSRRCRLATAAMRTVLCVVDDEPIDRIDDIRRAMRLQIDALTNASAEFRDRRDINDRDAAGAIDLLRDRILELAALLSALIAEVDASEYRQAIADSERETVDDLPPATGSHDRRDELDELRKALQRVLVGIDGDRLPAGRILSNAKDTIEAWARQRRNEVVDPDERIDLACADAPVRRKSSM